MNFIVVDDDRSVIPPLEAACRTVLGPDRASFLAIDTVDAAIGRLASSSTDVLVVDPRLEGGRGQELLNARTAALLPVIVITSDLSLAVRAFECGVIDFIPKPVVPARLELALRRLGPVRDRGTQARSFLAARRSGRIDLVDIDELVYVEGADKYSELVRADGRRVLHDKGLSRLEEDLPPSFVRIHKSFLVRLAMVARLRVLRGSRYFAELTTGQRLPVGRSRYGSLKARMI